MTKVIKNRLQTILKQAEKSRAGAKNVMTLHTLYVLRRDRRTHTGFYIDFRMTYKGIRFQRATGIKVKNATDLNAQGPAIKNNPEQTAMLKDIQNQAQKLFLECKLTERPIDLELIWGCILGIDHLRDKTPSLLGLIVQFEKSQAERHEVSDVSRPTHNKILRWNRYLNEFITATLGKSAAIDDFKPAHAQALEAWLKKHKRASHNYTQHIITHLKRVLNYAVEHEYIYRNPLLNFRRSIKTTRGEYLTIQEVELLEKATLFDPMLQIARDIAVFMAWTGLAYIDMNTLRNEHIKRTTDGDFFIEKARQKTGQPTIVYLGQKPLEILERYRENPICQRTGLVLPMLTNQGLNRILKELAPLAGIKKIMTCHCLRRTYATILYAKGTDEKAIRASMGHATLAMTEKHYAALQPDAIVRELKSRLAQ
ncbi:MAG: tyrosine-type recombinase/integrase [Spirosomataceae bacterium]